MTESRIPVLPSVLYFIARFMLPPVSKHRPSHAYKLRACVLTFPTGLIVISVGKTENADVI